MVSLAFYWPPALKMFKYRKATVKLLWQTSNLNLAKLSDTGKNIEQYETIGLGFSPLRFVAWIPLGFS